MTAPLDRAATEPSAEEREIALGALKQARGWQMEYDLPPTMRESLVDAIAAALHARAEAVRAETLDQDAVKGK